VIELPYTASRQPKKPPKKRVRDRSQYFKDWRVNNPDGYKKHRDRLRLIKTGWTPEDFDSAWASQEGRCQICCVQLTKTGRGKFVANADHNHKTKQKRALLCGNCNSGIGQFLEDPDLLAAAIYYLNWWSRHAHRT
jgi:hypothetical protein